MCGKKTNLFYLKKKNLTRNPQFFLLYKLFGLNNFLGHKDLANSFKNYFEHRLFLIEISLYE